jgi:hypothetical protein
MYYLFTDETNKEPSKKSEFFIYGGVFVHADTLPKLHKMVEDIRDRYGFQQGDSFKFSSYDKPDHVERDDFTMAKREVLQGCSELGVNFSACLVLHQIARNKTTDELITFGANTIIANFDYFLEEMSEVGVCIVDRLPIKDGFSFLRDRFQLGLELETRMKPVPRILLYAASCDGASHAMSAIDIILGAFRYCVNERDKDITPKEMLPVIAKMMWTQDVDGVPHVQERGLLLRPKIVKVDEYKKAYSDLVDHLQSLII